VAQRVLVSLVDDLDGSEADETIQFGLDGVSYEIDLSSDNAEDLREVLAEYIGHGRRAGGRNRRSGKRGKRAQAARSSTADREQNQAIRAWARDNGYTISERGRIPADVSEAYHKAR
jgi:hypothetical protein